MIARWVKRVGISFLFFDLFVAWEKVAADAGVAFVVAEGVDYYTRLNLW